MAEHVLQFFATLDSGGAENRMMDVYRCVDTGTVIFDFAVLHEGSHYFDNEAEVMGSSKYVLPDPRRGLIKCYFEMKRFFAAHPEFRAVHAHVAWFNGIVLLAAKRAGIKTRIAHARDSKYPDRSFKDELFCNIGKFLIARSATQRIAISPEAAENIFGKRAVKNGRYLFVPNAIDQKKYTFFTPEKRYEIRSMTGIPHDKKAYVTVANLRKQKNHRFLLEIAKALKDINDDFILYLIGEGDLRSEIESGIREMGLDNCVKLLGSRGDVPDILCAFDCMIFPSLFEGLGGVVLESQLVGVPAVVSDRIPKVVDVGIDMVKYISLDESAKHWAREIIDKTENYHWEKERTEKAFREKGYMIEETAKTYLKEYGFDEEMIRKAMKN